MFFFDLFPSMNQMRLWLLHIRIKRQECIKYLFDEMALRPQKYLAWIQTADRFRRDEQPQNILRPILACLRHKSEYL
ncbi:hypothetical protein N878_26965 [Pseudomonas sp. EGD-AK9]|nr:hypothetical protein N878_26965 [Pseudomonas sp. EGD-AK9]